MAQTMLEAGYVDGGGCDIKARMEDFYQNSYTTNSGMWAEGQIDQRFKAGDQTLFSLIYGEENWYSKRRFFFNLIRRQMNMIVGYQRANRKNTIALPVGQNDDGVSDDANQILGWQERTSGFPETFSTCAEGAWTSGIGMMHFYPDYSQDPVSGDLQCDNVAFNNFLIDPYFRKQDLSDCNGIWRRRWMTKSMLMGMLPMRHKEIQRLKPGGNCQDGKFPYQAEALRGAQSNLHTYDEFHYLTTRPAKMIVDLQGGETAEWKGTDEELKEVMYRNPYFVVHNGPKPTVNLAIVVDGRVMYDGPNLLEYDGYPFVPVLGYFDPDMQSYSYRIQGVVRNLRDAQYLYNRRRVLELDILESQAQSGWLYKVDAPVNQEDLVKARKWQSIAVNEDAELSDIQRIQPPQVPPSMIELSRALAEDISNISGVNEELLGSATDDKAGILAQLRQGAGLITLQTLFDRLDYSQKLCGRIMLHYAQNQMAYGKIRRILERDPNPRFFNLDVSRFDLAVTQGANTVTQRQRRLQMLLHLKEIMPIPDDQILEAADIPNRKELMESMNQQRQQEAQLAQQSQQIQQLDLQLKIERERAKAALDMAKTQETMAKTQETIANTEVKQLTAERIEEEIAEINIESLLNLAELQGQNIPALEAQHDAILDSSLQDQSTVANINIETGFNQ